MKDFNHIRLVITISILLFGKATLLYGEYTLHHIDIQVKAIPEAQGNYNLLVKLTNLGGSPLAIYKGDLPWNSTRNMLLVAVKVSPHYSVIEEYVYIDDPGPEKSAIKVAETIDGKIILQNRFPHLPDTLKSSDVILFWNYELYSINNTKPQRYGGWLLIPKEKKEREKE